MPDYKDLTDLHLAILGVLWVRRTATIADIHEAIGERMGVSRKTVATLLSRLEQRELVRHRQVGQVSVYTSTVRRRTVLLSRLSGLLGVLFDVPDQAGTAQMIRRTDVQTGDVERLRALLRRAERDIGEGG
ncbi:MAG TPA: BlaI/MecI/CopY family transcriptional regulator [Vicinamibacterales bacterium]|nr:BlaI/MecI/CopY family transcriptional regulator [Vicinamibacterales bacterium]